MKEKLRCRFVYAVVFCVILTLEVVIALFIRDDFIRPYGGDVLVTVLICCFLRMFVPYGAKLLPAYVFVFALCVEIGQYFDFVTLLGLGSSVFFRTLLGSTFSVADILCYAAGCILFAAAEAALHHAKSRRENH